MLGWLNNEVWVVAGSAALCGACLGFLPYNLAGPAKIFLGDGGSMPLGFAVAMLVASAARGAEPSLLSLLTGLALVGLPVLDTTLVIVSRRRRGISVLTGGQDHLTHRTKQRVRTARRVALVLGASQALISALVIVAARTSSTTLVYAVLAFSVTAAMSILWLERASELPSHAAVLAEEENALPEGREMLFRTSSRPGVVGSLALSVLGLGAGLSPLFSAYYGIGVWIPVGLVLVIAAALERRFDRTASRCRSGWRWVAWRALDSLSLISSGWAQTAEAAVTDGNRWLVYVALVLLAGLLLTGAGTRGCC